MRFIKKYKIFVYLCTGIIFLTGCSSNGFETENISYGEIIEESTQSSVSITETSLLPSESIDSELRYSSSGAEENQSAFNEEIPSSEVISWCFYYEQLNDKEKEVYKNILAGCETFESEIKVDVDSLESLYKIWHAFNFDNPQFFWTSNFTYYTIGEKPVSIEFNIDESFKDTFNKLNSVGDDIVSNIPSNATDYEKVKFLYEYIINTVDYVDGAPNDQDIRSSLLNKQSVCAGYSRAFEFLCKKAGIKCTYVSGTANGGPHGWNLVMLDDKYYWVDVTWGDPVYESENSSWNKLNYDFLLVDDEMFLTSHIVDTGLSFSDSHIDNLFTYPSCNDKSYDYYCLNNSYFETYDRNTIYSFISDKISNGEKIIELKFKNFNEMQKAYNDIFTEDSFIFEIMRNLDKGWSTYSYTYTYNEQANTISIEITSN